MNVLVLDVGGTHVKMLVTGATEKRKFVSGAKLVPAEVVSQVKVLAADWSYEAVAIGYPGVVLHDRIVAEPHNLGTGWLGFDFEKAFGKPVKVVNDAAMQALGSYNGGRMLFLGLGTGLGSAMIVDGDLQPMELAHLPYRKGRTYEEEVGLAGLDRMGKKKWRTHVADVIETLRAALQVDEVVVGGGNAAFLKELPPNTRLGANTNAFLGGFRLWGETPQGAAVTDPAQPKKV